MRLKQIRIAKGLSQKRLSELSGVTQGYISDIESGASEPTVRILRKLAKALDTSITELIDEEAALPANLGQAIAHKH